MLLLSCQDKSVGWASQMSKRGSNGYAILREAAIKAHHSKEPHSYPFVVVGTGKAGIVMTDVFESTSITCPCSTFFPTCLG